MVNKVDQFSLSSVQEKGHFEPQNRGPHDSVYIITKRTTNLQIISVIQLSSSYLSTS